MAKRFFKLTFPQELITEPILYNLGKQFKVITNVFRANVTHDSGWVLLQLEGRAEDIDNAVSWAREKGVTVEQAAEESLKAPSRQQ